MWYNQRHYIYCMETEYILQLLKLTFRARPSFWYEQSDRNFRQCEGKKMNWWEENSFKFTKEGILAARLRSLG